MKQYRWDKRREKKRADNIISRHGFDVFDLVLLILVFTLGVVLYRLFTIFALTMSACTDMAANFGASAHTPPVFKLFVTISLLMLALWFIHMITGKRGKHWSWINTVWQAFICICIILFGVGSYHMSIWDNPRPPDGTLAVADGIWGLENGERVWKNLPLLPYLDKDRYGNTVYHPQHREQKCVWVDAGLISVNDDSFIGDHGAFIKKTMQDYKETGYGPRIYQRRLLFDFKAHWKALYTRQSWVETLRDHGEHTRPLTPEERTRFLHKQKCVKGAVWDPYTANAMHRASRLELCDPRTFPPLPKEWQSPYFIYTPQP